MLDPVVHKHLDVMESLEAKMDAEIDEIIKGIDIEVLMQDPRGTITAVTDYISEMLIEEYMPKAVKAGDDFAERSKEIEVPDTSNPKLNNSLDDKS